MYGTIRQLGIVPFFINPIPEFSIEEMTPKDLWFNDEDMGPWDWKIFAVQQGDIAYGKFLYGGKSAFATVEWYRELMNCRRSLPKYQPAGLQAEVLHYIREQGSATTRDLRKVLGLKKNKTDALLTRLQMDTLVVIGDFERVYRGEDLHYSGWQLASFCTPEDLFQDIGAAVSHSPAASRERLLEHLRKIAPQATARQLQRLIGEPVTS